MSIVVGLGPSPSGLESRSVLRGVSRVFYIVYRSDRFGGDLSLCRRSGSSTSVFLSFYSLGFPWSVVWIESFERFDTRDFRRDPQESSTLLLRSPFPPGVRVEVGL